MTSIYSSIETFTLNANECSAARSILKTFAWGSEIPVYPAIAIARALWIQAMPIRILAALDAMGSGTGPAAAVITNVPYDWTIKTGLRDPMIAYPEKADRISEALALGAAAYLGEPYGIHEEGHGVVNNLSPTLEDADRHTGNGSRRELGLHIENAALRRQALGICPDGLVLVGVSADPIGNPPTMVADARAAYDAATPDTQERLQQDVALKVPERWRASFSETSVRAPVVRCTHGVRDFAFAFYGDMTTAPDRSGQMALAEFEAKLVAQAVAIEVVPGTMAIVNNRVAAHGRGEFEASFTTEGLPCRWLQRVFWSRNIDRFEMLRQVSPRVFTPDQAC